MKMRKAAGRLIVRTEDRGWTEEEVGVGVYFNIINIIY